MNNQSDNNKMGSLLKIIVLGVGAAGALYGAVKFILGQQESGHSSNHGNRPNSTRIRPTIQESSSKECQICSEAADELVVFLPCTHTYACLECGAKMRKCILCKMVIAERRTEDTNMKIPYVSPRINDDLTCPICCDNKRRIIFNCGHTVCHVCSGKVQECPVCRETIITRNKFF